MREDLASTLGASYIGFRQNGNEAVYQSVQAKLARIVDLDDYIYAADASASVGAQRAADALAATGGEIRLDPKKRYTWGSSVTVTSAKHICFTGANFGQVYDATGPGIAIVAPIDSVFRAEGPTRPTSGGVSFYGISFYDATGSGGTPGTNTIARAALDMYDASQSAIEACQFHFIKGSAIRTDFFTMSSIKGCRIRYCGDAGKNVVDINETSPAFYSQSVVLHDNRIEVCYGDAYLHTSPRSQSITISSCVFESAPTEYPASAVPYIQQNGGSQSIISCTFNRNTAQAVTINGTVIMTGCFFFCGPGANNSLALMGSQSIIIGNFFSDEKGGVSVRAVGPLNQVNSNHFYANGGVSMEAVGNQFHDNYVTNPYMTGGGYYVVAVDYCSVRDNVFSGHDYVGFGPLQVNAVVLYAPTSIATGNTFREWTGKTAIRVEAAGATYMPNTHDGNGTFVTVSVDPRPSVAAAASLVLPATPGETRHVVVTGNTQINQIVGGYQYLNMTVVLCFTGTPTVLGSNNVKLTGAFAGANGKRLYLMCDGTDWTEIKRFEP